MRNVTPDKTVNRRRRSKAPMGRRSYYRPKYKGKTVMLTQLGWRILESTADRSAKSESDVVENLLRRYAAEVTFDEKTEQ